MSDSHDSNEGQLAAAIDRADFLITVNGPRPGPDGHMGLFYGGLHHPDGYPNFKGPDPPERSNNVQRLLDQDQGTWDAFAKDILMPLPNDPKPPQAALNRLAEFGLIKHVQWRERGDPVISFPGSVCPRFEFRIAAMQTTPGAGDAMGQLENEILAFQRLAADCGVPSPKLHPGWDVPGGTAEASYLATWERGQKRRSEGRWYGERIENDILINATLDTPVFLPIVHGS